MKNKYFFAVDLGATSGRTVIGTLTDDKVKLCELTRFDNPIIEVNGHCHWNILSLYQEIIKGLQKVAADQIPICSIGIDTWGVDVVLVGKDGSILRNPYSYRDPHTTNEVMEHYFEHVPKASVYEIAGIQFMNINTLFQLYALRRNHDSALEVADKILFMPDALTYLLTHEMVTEYTILSTSGMMNPRTGEISQKLIEPIGLSQKMFGRQVNPGTIVGQLTQEVAKLTGLAQLPVVAVAGHDTASAVAAVPAKNKNFAYLSSGTWSLMGIETSQPIINNDSYRNNFTNEGGIEGTTRFLKNICGMWLLERCRKEWKDAPVDYTQLIAAAMQVSSFQSFINPDSPCFANPTNMTEAIQTYCKITQQHVPTTYAELTRCIFESLALRYKQIFEMLEQLAPFAIECLHVIGGGSRNALLNQFTCNAIKKPVVAGPSECTAMGNIMLQAKAACEVTSISEMRRIIANSVELKYYEPTDTAMWDSAYTRYLAVYREDI